uniref:Uncharacterized protein n=1 Tax=Oryza meridionalis TaxID=40149 RepID=A0A0E0DWV1_9ORYZ
MACQLRSISLPATRPNVLVRELEHELQRLRASSCSSPAAAALVALGDAYGRVEELVRLPATTSSRRDGDDAPWRRRRSTRPWRCSTCASSPRTPPRPPNSTSARRRRPRDAGTSSFTSTEAQRLVRCLTKVTRNASNAKKKVVAGKRSLAAQNETPPAVKALSEAMAATVAVLRGVATSLYKRIVDTKKRRWFVVSRFLRNDWSSHSHHPCKDLEGDGEVLLQGLEESVEGVESGLEYLFSCLVQSRVALLNMLTL